MFIPYMANRFVGGMTLYLRTSLDPTQALSAVARRCGSRSNLLI